MAENENRKTIRRKFISLATAAQMGLSGAGAALPLYKAQAQPAVTSSQSTTAPKTYSEYADALEKYNEAIRNERSAYEKKVRAYWKRVAQLKHARDEEKLDANKSESYVTETLPIYKSKFQPPSTAALSPADKARVDADNEIIKKSNAAEEDDLRAERAKRIAEGELKADFPLESAGVPRYSQVAQLDVGLNASAKWGYTIDRGEHDAAVASASDAEKVKKAEDIRKSIAADLQRIYHPAINLKSADRERLQQEIKSKRDELAALTGKRDESRENLFFDKFLQWTKEFGVPPEYTAGIMAVEVTANGKHDTQAGTLAGGRPISSGLGYSQIISTTFYNFALTNKDQLLRELKKEQATLQGNSTVNPEKKKKLGQLITHLEEKVFPALEKNKDHFNKFAVSEEGRAAHSLLADINFGPLAQALFKKTSLDELKRSEAKYNGYGIKVTPALAELNNLAGPSATQEFVAAPKGAVMANFMPRSAILANIGVLNTGDRDKVIAELAKRQNKGVNGTRLQSLLPKGTTFDAAKVISGFSNELRAVAKVGKPAPDSKHQIEPTDSAIEKVRTNFSLAMKFEKGKTAGAVLASEGKTESQTEIASLAKFGTALIALEKIERESVDINKTRISISQDIVHQSLHRDSVRAKAGQEFTVKELLELTMRKSSNWAATALGEWAAGGDEAKATALINTRVKALGINNFFTINPSGHPIGNLGAPNRRDAKASPQAVSRLAAHVTQKYSDYLDQLRSRPFKSEALNHLIKPTSPLNGHGKHWSMVTKTGSDKLAVKAVTALKVGDATYSFSSSVAPKSNGGKKGSVTRANAQLMMDQLKGTGLLEKHPDLNRVLVSAIENPRKYLGVGSKDEAPAAPPPKMDPKPDNALAYAPSSAEKPAASKPAPAVPAAPAAAETQIAKAPTPPPRPATIGTPDTATASKPAAHASVPADVKDLFDKAAKIINGGSKELARNMRLARLHPELIETGLNGGKPIVIKTKEGDFIVGVGKGKNKFTYVIPTKLGEEDSKLKSIIDRSKGPRLELRLN